MERTIVKPTMQKELESILDKQMPAEIIDELDEVLTRYRQVHLMEGAEPRKGKPGIVLSHEKVEGGYLFDFVRKAGTQNAELKKLANAARKMAEVLKHPSYPQRLVLARVELPFDLETKSGTTEEIQCWLEEVALAANEGITKGIKGDVPHDYHIKHVVKIGVIYYRTTGRMPGRSRPSGGGAPHGPFVDFLRCCLFSADHKERGSSAIVKIFEKAKPAMDYSITQYGIIRKRLYKQATLLRPISGALSPNLDNYPNKTIHVATNGGRLLLSKYNNCKLSLRAKLSNLRYGNFARLRVRVRENSPIWRIVAELRSSQRYIYRLVEHRWSRHYDGLSVRSISQKRLKI